jgi:hypothetical protein
MTPSRFVAQMPLSESEARRPKARSCPSGGTRSALLPSGRSLNTGGQTGNEQKMAEPVG